MAVSTPAKVLKVFERYPTTVGRAIRNAIETQGGEAIRAAIMQAAPGASDIKLERIAIAGHSDDAIDFSATYSGRQAGEKTSYSIPVHMSGAGLAGLKAAIVDMMPYAADASFHAARAKSALLSANPALEAQLKAAFATMKYPEEGDYISAVTDADGTPYRGARFHPKAEPFNHHPGQPAKGKGPYRQPPVVGKPGRVYVTTDTRMGFSGDEMLYTFVRQGDRLVLEDERTLSMS